MPLCALDRDFPPIFWRLSAAYAKSEKPRRNVARQPAEGAGCLEFRQGDHLSKEICFPRFECIVRSRLAATLEPKSSNTLLTTSTSVTAHNNIRPTERAANEQMEI